MTVSETARRRWVREHAAIPDAMARLRRDGVVIETFLPPEVAPTAPELIWDGRTLVDILGQEGAAHWLTLIARALDEGGIVRDRFEWTLSEPHWTFAVHLVSSGPDEVLAIAREIGYEERLEAERDAMHALLERTTDLLPDIIYIFDEAERRIVFQNRSIAEDLGYPPERIAEFGDFPMPHLLHPDDLLILPDVLARTISAGDDEVMSYEGRLRDAAGSYRTYVSHSRVFERRADGTPFRVLGVMRDVTDQRAFEQQLHEAARLDALGLVAGVIAHDFNNALTAIRGFTELMAPEVGPAATEDLDELRAAIDRAAGLTSRLLAFSRYEQRQLVPLDLSQHARRIEPMLARLLGPGVQLVMALPAEPAVVRADPLQLEQLMINLALNARDAMPRGGTLRIEVAIESAAACASFSEETNRWVVLSMSDTGIGMAPEIRSRVFEPFFTTKPAGQGTGLGLSSAQLAVSHAGGTLEVQSEVGRGSTFRVRLPWCAVPLPSSAEATPGARAEGNSRGSVLVVDDEPMVLRLIEATLLRAGHRVHATPDHRVALRIAQDPHESIDLLISDVVMPEVNGPDLVTRVRELRPKLPVLFVSGFYEEAQIPSALDAELLRKPFSPRQLADTAARLLAPIPPKG